MLGRLDPVPGVAGDDPAVGRFVLQRVEVLGLAGQHADHLAALEQAAGIALAHKLGQVGTEQHVEDRVGLGVCQGLHHAAGIQLAQRRCLLGDEFDIRLRGFQQLLEGGRSRLAVLVVGVNHRPAFLLELDRLGHQHRALHVSAGAQPEGVAVAVLPDDLVGQRLTGQVEKLLLLGEIGQCQPDVGQKGAGQHVDLFTRDQLFGCAHRVTGVAVVVPGDQLDLFAIESAGGVDLVDGQLHALLVGLQKGGLRLVAVDLADLDHALGLCGGDGQRLQQRLQQREGGGGCEGSADHGGFLQRSERGLNDSADRWQVHEKQAPGRPKRFSSPSGGGRRTAAALEALFSA